MPGDDWQPGESGAEKQKQRHSDRGVPTGRRSDSAAYRRARTWERGGLVGSSAACGARWLQSSDRWALTCDRGGQQVGPSGRQFLD
jgi:hypothetical protein